jgi:hypothetical protein
VRELKHLADHADAATIMHKLKEIVPEFAGDVLAGPHHSDLSGNGESDKPKGAASGARLRKKTAVLGSARRTVSGPATDTTIGALPSRDAGAPEQDAH